MLSHAILGKAVALLLGVLATGCELTRMKWGSDVTFELDPKSVKVGAEVEVRFSVLKREPGWRYAVALVPDETRLEDHSAAVEVPEGQMRLGLRPSRAGLHAVRVYRSVSGETHYVAGGKVQVEP